MHGPSPGAWWGRAQDRSLVVGVRKHGFGQWDAIRADPDLAFYGFVEQPSAAPSSQSGLIKWPSAGALARRFDGTLSFCVGV